MKQSGLYSAAEHDEFDASVNVHFVCVYLVGPDEGLDGQVILHQLLHVGLSSNQRGELRSLSQTQRRLVGGTRGGAGVGVPEEDVPGLGEGKGERMSTLLPSLGLWSIQLFTSVWASFIFSLITIIII